MLSLGDLTTGGLPTYGARPAMMIRWDLVQEDPDLVVPFERESLQKLQGLIWLLVDSSLSFCDVQ